MKKIFNFRPLFYCFIAFLSAILFAKYLLTTSWPYLAVFIVAIFSLLTVSIIRKKLKIFLCIIFFFSAGILGYCIEMNTYDVEPLQNASSVVARVEKVDTNNSVQYVVLDSVIVNDESINYSMKLTIYGAPYVTVGDIVSFTSDISIINAYSQTGDIRTDYYKNNIRYSAISSNYELEIVGNKAHLNDKLQVAIYDKLLENMDKENASIAYAMLLGDKSGIEDDTMSAYRTSGIAHVLAISGLHIGLLVGCLFWVLKKCKAKNWLILVIITAILVLYCYLCGFSSSVVRASIMSICLLLSTVTGRKYDSLSAIGLAGLILLFLKPLYAFDVGFQLSFACVIAIAIFYRPIYNYIRKIKIPKFIASPLAITLCTQLVTLPILINSFGSVSFLSVFANLLVVPVFSLAYIITFISTPLLFISNFFGNISWFANLLMQFNTLVANFFSSISWSIIPKFDFSLLALSGYYAVIFFSSRLVFVKPQTKLIVCLSITAFTSVFVGLLQLI